MKKVTEITSSSKGVVVEIDVGHICNYKCPYCFIVQSPEDSWIDYNSLEKFVKRVKPKQIILSGGEPTYHPKISQMMKAFKDSQLDLITNGSRSLEWWKEHYKYIDSLVFSYHSDFAVLEEFIQKIKFLSQHIVVTINIVAIDNKMNEIFNVISEFRKIDNVYCMIKPYIVDGKAFNNQDTLRHTGITFSPLKRTLPPQNYIKMYEVVEGKKMLIKPQRLISDGRNTFRGWNCWKGIDLLRVFSDGNVCGASCDLGENKSLGNINSQVRLPTNPSVCTHDTCFCITDLRLTRKKRR